MACSPAGQHGTWLSGGVASGGGWHMATGCHEGAGPGCTDRPYWLQHMAAGCGAPPLSAPHMVSCPLHGVHLLVALVGHAGCRVGRGTRAPPISCSTWLQGGAGPLHPLTTWHPVAAPPYREQVPAAAVGCTGCGGAVHSCMVQEGDSGHGGPPTEGLGGLVLRLCWAEPSGGGAALRPGR